MKSASPDSSQKAQRVRVGLTGLASVALLIAFASAIFSSANREAPVTAVGAPNASVVANMADGAIANTTAETKDEPLAELGVAPSTASTEAVNSATVVNGTDGRR
jgi:hypothetical protein